MWLGLGSSGGSDRTLEGPIADVVDLLLHGAGEWNRLGGNRDQVLLDYGAILDASFGNRGDHALLNLSTSPTGGKLHDLRQIELTGVNGATRQVNAEDQARQMKLFHDVQLLQARIKYTTIAGAN